MDGYIEGLLQEKERLVRAGLFGRVRQVDAELVRVGYSLPKPKPVRKKTAERADVAAPEQAVPDRPKRRSSR